MRAATAATNMSLLELEGIHKRGHEGRRERPVLRDVSLHVEAGEMAVVWGPRRSGSSTLLRIAAGLEAPDAGSVRFEGRDLAEAGEELRGVRIGYVQQSFRSAEGRSVLSLVTAGLLAHGLPATRAREGAQAALARVGAEHCLTLSLPELDEQETLHVALARTLTLRPRLLVIDEPIKGVTLLQRDAILRLLRSLANDGLAVLASTADSTGLTGADRALALDEGELRASREPTLAPVVPLRSANG